MLLKNDLHCLFTFLKKENTHSSTRLLIDSITAHRIVATELMFHFVFTLTAFSSTFYQEMFILFCLFCVLFFCGFFGGGGVGGMRSLQYLLLLSLIIVVFVYDAQ